MIKNYALSALLLFQFAISMAQSGLPKSLTMDLFSREVPIEQMPAVDVATLMAEDEINNALKIGPYRFGENIEVSINANSNGLWEEMKGGARLWRMGFRCEGAYSVNFIFDDLYLPVGSTLHFYDANGSTVYGPFTNEDNRADGGFATFPLPGQIAFIEYYEPAIVRGMGRISLQTVTHAYRDIFRLDESRGGGSGACNNNVNCPEGADWQDHKRSVAIMISGGSGFCTGAMVNNTAQDGTPYFLSANHCMGGATNNWVFKFDYERTGCANTGGPNLSGGNFTQGAVIRAQNAGSDFALLELNSEPLPAHNVYYSGWDRSGVAPTNSIAIHHPSGDYKKISFDNDAATPENWQSAACWHISNWEDGTTEPGSSGSPLFDQNQRIIGQLFGGSANCNNNVDDYYGRFNVSWDGSSSSTRLRDWLDPQNTGALTLDGFDPNAPTVALDASAQAIGGVTSGATLCDNIVTPTLTLRNRGTDVLTSATINWSVDGVAQTPLNWTGSLDFNDSEVLTFDQQTFAGGDHTIEFSVSAPNGASDENLDNDVISVNFTTVDGDEISVVIQLDNYPGETSWEIRNDLNVLVASGDGYSTPNAAVTIPTCLADGCYTFTIMDDYDDGICCGFGQGFYEVNDPFGNMIGEGAQFTDQESVEFCLPFIVPVPEASFSVATTTICTGVPLTFNNTSTPANSLSYAWVFQGGSPSTSSIANPVVTFNNSGTFDVSLTVTNSAGTDVLSSPGYITVNASPSASTSSTGENLWEGGANGTATVEVTGGTEPYSIDWNPGTQTGTTISGLTAGNYTAVVTDANGCSTSATVTVGSNVGINDLTLADVIRTYPNPSSGLVNIELPTDRAVIHISLSDMTGRTVKHFSPADVHNLTLDISSLSEGVYHLNFFTESNRATKKLVHLKQ
jgi:lysyl endopeptidase